MSEKPPTMQMIDDTVLDKKKQWHDFWLGLIGSLVGNVLFVVISFILSLGLAASYPTLSKSFAKSLTYSA